MLEEKLYISPMNQEDEANPEVNVPDEDDDDWGGEDE